MSRLTRDGTAPRSSRETKFSGPNGVQLTTSRIGNLPRLIHTLAIRCDDHTRCIISCRAHIFLVEVRPAITTTPSMRDITQLTKRCPECLFVSHLRPMGLSTLGQRWHPACGHKESSHPPLFLALWFLSRCESSVLTFSRFPLQHNIHIFFAFFCIL